MVQRNRDSCSRGVKALYVRSGRREFVRLVRKLIIQTFTISLLYSVQVKAGVFMLSDPSHARTAPTLYPMLTCAVNALGEVDVKRFAFQMITSNKTIVFGCDTKEECDEWVSVLLNAKNQCMDEAFKNSANDVDNTFRGRKMNRPDEKVRIVRGVISTIRQLPGNNLCADCGCPEPAWFSVNLGVLVCIECSGLHREMGVQVFTEYLNNVDSI